MVVMDYVTLIGAEDVRSAGNSIRQGAADMQRAADSIESTLMTFRSLMEDWLFQFERIVDKMK